MYFINVSIHLLINSCCPRMGSISSNNKKHTDVPFLLIHIDKSHNAVHSSLGDPKYNKLPSKGCEDKPHTKGVKGCVPLTLKTLSALIVGVFLIITFDF